MFTFLQTKPYAQKTAVQCGLVGGFNPSEKYARQIGFIFPNFRGENKKYLSCHHLAVQCGPLDILGHPNLPAAAEVVTPPLGQRSWPVAVPPVAGWRERDLCHQFLGVANNHGVFVEIGNTENLQNYNRKVMDMLENTIDILEIIKNCLSRNLIDWCFGNRAVEGSWTFLPLITADRSVVGFSKVLRTANEGVEIISLGIPMALWRCDNFRGDIHLFCCRGLVSSVVCFVGGKTGKSSRDEWL